MALAAKTVIQTTRGIHVLLYYYPIRTRHASRLFVSAANLPPFVSAAARVRPWIIGRRNSRV
jgi:hypothetical protein